MNQRPVSPTSEEEVRLRRAPRIGVFLIGGALLGAIATFVLTAMFEADPEIGFGVLVGYFMIYGVPLGLGLGAIVALVLDHRSKRRAKLVVAEREHGDDEPEQTDDDVTKAGWPPPRPDTPR